jgi:hypothetical protein
VILILQEKMKLDYQTLRVNGEHSFIAERSRIPASAQRQSLPRLFVDSLSPSRYLTLGFFEIGEDRQE